MTHKTNKYVIQSLDDGKFYWKDKSISSRWDFDSDFSRAYLFDTLKGAQQRAKGLPGHNHVLPVDVILTK